MNSSVGQSLQINPGMTCTKAAVHMFKLVGDRREPSGVFCSFTVELLCSAEFIIKLVYTFRSLRDHLIPKSLKYTHSATKVK